MVTGCEDLGLVAVVFVRLVQEVIWSSTSRKSKVSGIGRSSLSSKRRDETACSRLHLCRGGSRKRVEGCGRLVQARRGQRGSCDSWPTRYYGRCRGSEKTSGT